MKTFDLLDSRERLIAFEIENAGVGRHSVCTLIKTIPNAQLVRRPKLLSWFREDVFCEFIVEGEPYIAEEPFGDNSRYWIGPMNPRWLPQTEGVRDAFAGAPQPRLLRWLGVALGVAFVVFGVFVLSEETVGERASFLVAVSLIGTGAYFVNYALTGRSTFWSRRHLSSGARETTMTTFETDGFLSDEISDFEAPAAERYARKFELAVDANRIAHGLIYSVQVHNEHLPDILLATLLTRQTTSFQSFYILLTKGLFFQSQILLRNVAENMFIIGASRKDPEFVDKYVLSEEVTRKKSLDALVRDERSRGNEVEQEVLDLIATLAEKIENEGATTFTTERIAQIAELSSYYDTLYRLTSMSVHTSSRGLDSALETDDNGTITAVTYEPIFDGLDMYLDYGISMMLYSLHEIARHFEQPVEEIEALQARNQELAGPTE